MCIRDRRQGACAARHIINQDKKIAMKELHLCSENARHAEPFEGRADGRESGQGDQNLSLIHI